MVFLFPKIFEGWNFGIFHGFGLHTLFFRNFRNFEIQMKISIFWGHFFWFTQRPERETGEKPRLVQKSENYPQLGTNPPFLPRKNSKHRYTASVAFSSKYKIILVNENTQRNSYESFLSKCLHLRDRLFFISPLLKFYYEHHLRAHQIKAHSWQHWSCSNSTKLH